MVQLFDMVFTSKGAVSLISCAGLLQLDEKSVFFEVNS